MPFISWMFHLILTSQTYTLTFNQLSNSTNSISIISLTFIPLQQWISLPLIATTRVLVFITSKLGYWTGHLQCHHCLPYLFLQLSLYMTAKLIFLKEISVHIATLLKNFCWLTHCLRISSPLTFLLLLSHSLSRLFTKEKLNTTNVPLTIVHIFSMSVCTVSTSWNFLPPHPPLSKSCKAQFKGHLYYGLFSAPHSYY